MISFIRGTIVEKQPTRLVLDAHGIGYEIHATINCTERIGLIGEEVTVLTHLHVREDMMQLYGFLSQAERTFFQQLISSPGIGPKKALAILSSADMSDLQQYIIEENITALNTLPGIGKKTAQRLVVDLKEKLLSIPELQRVSKVEGKTAMNVGEEALLALLSLGYPKPSAQKVIQTILSQAAPMITIEEVIKQALKKL